MSREELSHDRAGWKVRPESEEGAHHIYKQAVESQESWNRETFEKKFKRVHMVIINSKTCTWDIFKYILYIIISVFIIRVISGDLMVMMRLKLLMLKECIKILKMEVVYKANVILYEYVQSS